MMPNSDTHLKFKAPRRERSKCCKDKFTHMPQIPKVACQTPEQDQWEMNGSCFSVENHISLDQASQRPVKTS